MKWSVVPLDLEARHLFRISRGARKVFENYLLEIDSGEETGLGEGAPVEYLGLDRETGTRALQAADPGAWLEVPESAHDLDRLFDVAWKRLGGDRPAVSALDSALWDLLGKRVDQPVWRMIGADPQACPRTSFTIGIDDEDVMIRKIEEAEAYPILKLKVGFDGDVEMVRRLRGVTEKVFRVDANEGWSAKEAREKIPTLADLNVEMVEQPLPRDRMEEMPALKEDSALPLFADESCLDPGEVERIPGSFHGINIKLSKCGGITPALRMIRLAREGGLEVMLGCMLESSVGITAAAHLSPLVDLADLDGHVLLARDPFRGVRVEEGWLRLPEGPGLGVERAP